MDHVQLLGIRHWQCDKVHWQLKWNSLTALTPIRGVYYLWHHRAWKTAMRCWRSGKASLV